MLPQVLILPFLTLTLIASRFSYEVALGFLGLTALAAIPWPSVWRTKLEKRGYAMTMAVHYWLTGDISAKLKESIKGYFVGWSYYKMSWNPSDIDSWLATTEQAIKSGTIRLDPTYEDVFQFIVNHRLLKP
jgi:hypothetical protein